FRKGASALGVLKDLGLHGGLFHFHWYLPDTRPLCPLKRSKLTSQGKMATLQHAQIEPNPEVSFRRSVAEIRKRGCRATGSSALIASLAVSFNHDYSVILD
ncbi:MAG: hypothetical protein JWL59_3409, partial [Chthoniobacteraceae bacterium]|nr:hypothetical protein [Chthoniobacteraceae bacterium]